MVALDLPTSWTLVEPADDLTARIFQAISGMMMGVHAAVARKDYEDRRRVAEGQAAAKARGAYMGRPEDVKRNAGIATMLGGRLVVVGRASMGPLAICQ